MPGLVVEASVHLSKLLLLSGLTACGGGPTENTETTAVELTEFSCELGFRTEKGEYTSFSEHSQSELVLGFQGFLFLQVYIKTDQSPDTCNAITSIDINGNASGSTQPNVNFDTSSISDEVLFFLPTANINEYIDTNSEIAVRLENATHFCTATSSVKLVDDDPCIHTDEEPICPDTGDTAL